jgi:hypothetical protein
MDTICSHTLHGCIQAAYGAYSLCETFNVSFGWVFYLLTLSELGENWVVRMIWDF